MSATRICIVKTSSMGDVIHALPVVSDIKRAMPDAQIDWLVEEAFADLPRLHRGVQRTIPLALRRWRKSLLADQTRSQIQRFRTELNAGGSYDAILDLQGLYKSALVACMAQGPRIGFSFRCAREPLASVFYSRRINVDMKAHAIERLRQLSAQAFNYPMAGLPRFEILAPIGDCPVAILGPYLVLLHATSRAEKLWPTAHWRELIVQFEQRGLSCVLPWGNDAERGQAAAIAEGLASALVPPRLTLKQCATLLGGAAAVVGVDTGLTHLAAALQRPTVSVFGVTEAWRYGPYWTPLAVNLGGKGQWPSTAQVVQSCLQLLGQA